MDYKALLFDLDGTILDNNTVYESAFREVLKEIGGKTLIETLPLKASIGIGPNWPILLDKYQVKTTKTTAELTKETQEEYLLNLGKVTVRPGFLDFVDFARKQGVRLALATSNERETVDICLKRFELEDVFEKITTAEDVENLKPAPDIFFKAAEKLEALPIDCLVVEDGLAGVRGAHAAGMRVAYYVHDGDEVAKNEADVIFTSYLELQDRV